MSSVAISNLSLNFGSVEVLKSLNLEVEEGEFVVLLGPSGCGKSTLLNCVAGLLDVTAGQIFINDNVPDINTFIDGIKDIVTIHKFDNLIDKYDLNVNRIGFVWHNDRMDIPFGSTELTIDNYTFTYFKKELIDYLQLYNNITVDLITCYLDDPLFLSEVEIIFNNLNNINIEYSLDATGNINGNWIMESNNSSM